MTDTRFLRIGWKRELRLRALMVRDWWDEFGVAWGLARMHDCVRRGGHLWGPIEDDEVFQSRTRTCRRCGCCEFEPDEPAPTTTGGLTFYVNATNMTTGRPREDTTT